MESNALRRALASRATRGPSTQGRRLGFTRGPTTRIRLHSDRLLLTQSIGGPMIGVLVTFTQTDKFDPSTVAKIADEERGTFEGMPGLRLKSFTLDDDGQARNFYLWDDEEKARAFFTDEVVDMVTGILWRRAQDRIPRRIGVRRQLWHLIRPDPLSGRGIEAASDETQQSRLRITSAARRAKRQLAQSHEVVLLCTTCSPATSLDSGRDHRSNARPYAGNATSVGPRGRGAVVLRRQQEARLREPFCE
jgi:hypothetical protein